MDGHRGIDDGAMVPPNVYGDGSAKECGQEARRAQESCLAGMSAEVTPEVTIG